MSLSQPGISFSVSGFLTRISVHVSVTARDIICWSRFLTCHSIHACLYHSQGYHSLCQRFHTCLSVTARDIICCVKVSYLSLKTCLCHSQGYLSLCQGVLSVSQSISFSQPGISFAVSRFLTCLSTHVCHSHGYPSLCQGFLPVP